ncbi:hypothetical protein ACHWQZ_G003684 [Mnemiopsis leidyi]
MLNGRYINMAFDAVAERIKKFNENIVIEVGPDCFSALDVIFQLETTSDFTLQEAVKSSDLINDVPTSAFERPL